MTTQLRASKKMPPTEGAATTGDATQAEARPETMHASAQAAPEEPDHSAEHADDTYMSDDQRFGTDTRALACRSQGHPAQTSPTDKRRRHANRLWATTFPSSLMTNSLHPATILLRPQAVEAILRHLSLEEPRVDLLREPLDPLGALETLRPRQLHILLHSRQAGDTPLQHRLDLRVGLRLHDALVHLHIATKQLHGRVVGQGICRGEQRATPGPATKDVQELAHAVRDQPNDQRAGQLGILVGLRHLGVVDGEARQVLWAEHNLEAHCDQ